MRLSEYLRQTSSEGEGIGERVRRFADKVKNHPATVERWLAWERRERDGKTNLAARSCSRPDADGILAIQIESGGMVTILDWQSVPDAAPESDAPTPATPPSASEAA